MKILKKSFCNLLILLIFTQFQILAMDEAPKPRKRSFEEVKSLFVSLGSQITEPFVVSEESLKKQCFTWKEKQELFKRVLDVPATMTNEFHGYCLFLSNQKLTTQVLSMIFNFFKNQKTPGTGYTSQFITIILLDKNYLKNLPDDLFCGFDNLVVVDLKDNEFLPQEKEILKMRFNKDKHKLILENTETGWIDQWFKLLPYE
jgi:hypothetical protein